MLQWLKKKALESFTETQRREMTSWIDNLSQMNSSEVAMLLCMATHLRHQIEEEKGIDLLDPINTYAAQPTVVLYLNGRIRDLQKNNHRGDASGVMIWLFTLRAGADPGLRGLGRRLWRELARGIPLADEAETDFYGLTNIILNTRGREQIPLGLEAQPL
jgi:hypothetical protein